MIDYLLNVGTALLIFYFLAANPQIITSLPADIVLMVSDIAAEITSSDDKNEGR
jgi:hypothetical protein